MRSHRWGLTTLFRFLTLQKRTPTDHYFDSEKSPDVFSIKVNTVGEHVLKKKKKNTDSKKKKKKLPVVPFRLPFPYPPPVFFFCQLSPKKKKMYVLYY